MGRDEEYKLSQQLKINLVELLDKINKVRSIYAKPMIVSSGYRPGRYNTAAKGAEKSLHITCQACDFYDAEGVLGTWCLINFRVLQKIGLYVEDPRHTVGWVHLQSVAPKSGSIVFIPGQKKTKVV